MNPTEISFSVTDDDAAMISDIVDRAEQLAEQPFDRMTMVMDITAAHANRCPLDLQGLLEADNFNFCHDVWGIHRRIDRETGEVNLFLPRYAAKSETAAA